MTRGRPPKPTHPRSLLGFVEHAFAILDPYASPCAQLLDERHETAAARNYRALKNADAMATEAMRLQLEYPQAFRDKDLMTDAGAIGFDAIVAQLVLRNLKVKADEARASTRDVSPADAAKARRARLVIGCLLLAAGKGVRDPYAAAADALFCDNPGPRDLANEARNIQRELERYLRESRQDLYRAFRELGDWWPVTSGSWTIVLGFRLHALIAKRMHTRLRPEMLAAGASVVSADEKIQSLARSGQLFTAAAEAEAQSSEIDLDAMTRACEWLFQVFLEHEIERLKAEEAQRREGNPVQNSSANPGYSNRAILLSEFGHAGKALRQNPTD